MPERRPGITGLCGSWLCWSGWLYAAAASCAEGAPHDSDRLSSLSTSQLKTLCAEILEAWPAERDAALSCEDGTSYFLYQDAISACGSSTTACSAWVGDWRECMRALAGTPCETATPEPSACTQLRLARGCSSLALPVLSQCTPPRLEQVSALEGVYRIAARTRNELSCDIEGADIEGADVEAADVEGADVEAADTEAEPESAHTFFALAVRSDPGFPLSPLRDTPMLVPVECSGIEACREIVAQLGSGGSPALFNESLPDRFACGPDGSGALHASQIRSANDGSCAATNQEVALLPQADGSVRIELRSFDLPFTSQGGVCGYSDATGPCLSLEVLHAERVAPL